MSDNYRALIEGNRSSPAVTEKTAETDDPAEPKAYQAIRRVFSFPFADVVFCRPTGAVRAFPWAYLRTWMIDETGTRLSLIWPETEVSLVGQHFDRIRVDVQRRVIAEFRQIPLGQADSLPAGTPVIMTMSFEPTGRSAGQ